MDEEILKNPQEEPSKLVESNSEEEIQIPRKLARQINEKHPEVFQGIEESNQAKVIQAIISELSISVERTEFQHSGPLPDAKTLALYAEIIPNGAERIMKMAENQSTHRINIENRVIKSEISQSLLGQIFAFILAGGLAIIGLVLTLKNYQVVGSTVFGFDIVGLATVFIVGRRKKNKSLKEE